MVSEELETKDSEKKAVEKKDKLLKEISKMEPEDHFALAVSQSLAKIKEKEWKKKTPKSLIETVNGEDVQVNHYK
eukprot:12412713-Karenia_brevis.AAC.1